MAWGRVAMLMASEQATPYLDDVADTFGYIRKPSGLSLKRTVLADEMDVSLTTDKITPPVETRQTRFWQVKSITHIEASNKTEPTYLNDLSRVIDLAKPQTGTYHFDKPDSDISFASLVPLLLNTLGEQCNSSRINQRKLVKRLSQGKTIKQLPTHHQTKWPPKLAIILDKHKKLFPYWHDFDTIAAQLSQLLGKEKVQIELFPENSNHPVSYPDNTAILILSDMQRHGNNARYWAWSDRLKQFRKQNCRILSLSPAKQSPQSQRVRKLARPQPLGPKGNIPRYPKQHGFNLMVKDHALDEALMMLSPLVLVDPGLLRKLRKAFAWGNAALEGVIWNDSRVVRGYLGICLRNEFRQNYHRQFERLENKKQQQLWNIVASHHKNAYQGLKNLESIGQLALSATPSTETGETSEIEYYQSLLATYKQNSQSHQSPESQNALKQQLKTLVLFTPANAWHTQNKLQELLHEVFAVAYSDEIRSGEWPQFVPEGLDVSKLEWVLDEKTQDLPVHYRFIQKGIKGEALITDEVPESGSTADQVLQFKASKMQPASIKTLENNRQQIIKGSQKIDAGKASAVQVKTARTQWQLQAIKRPAFAKNMGQNASGLFIETSLNDSSSRYYWLPEETDSSGNRVRGIWFPHAKLEEGMHRDQYGLYKDIRIKNIKQRFRWIEPGQFLMGSPVDELARYDDEDLHQVTLSSGLWLADTTISQALWQAVMGSNPSNFKGKNRPVETVSWNDVQTFIKQIQKTEPQLKLRLPSEAEWEYACRAGTQTPFYFGENISPEQVNYDGNRPYAEGEKGLARSATVELKSLPENAWGLYEMHGNIWEWCEDVWQENLGKEAVIDPLIDKKEGADRVVRGGSWIYGGRNVRSALRYHYSPVFADNSFGFRLALGHNELRQGADDLADRTVAKAEPRQSGLTDRLRNSFEKNKI